MRLFKAHLALRRLIHTTLQTAYARKATLDRDFILSVLESSATRRDAKGYLQKYIVNNCRHRPRPPRFIQRPGSSATEEDSSQSINVAIVRLRNPQLLAPDTLDGIARTLSQLRTLGLVAIVVVDCGTHQGRQAYEREALRLCEAIDNASLFGQPGAKLADGILVRQAQQHDIDQNIACDTSSSIFTSHPMHVDDQGLLQHALQHSIITVIPSLSRSDDLSSPLPTSSSDAVIAMTKFLTGLQFTFDNDDDDSAPPPEKLASVERIILLDPLGAVPMPGMPNLYHCFINLEQDYEPLMKYLMDTPSSLPGHEKASTQLPGSLHAANLNLVRHALALLPASSSALITTPLAASNHRARPSSTSPTASPFDFAEMMTTGTRRNPLLHNLLTDRPSSSPSLPLQRALGSKGGGAAESKRATLIKRGMPVTLYPDPRVKMWSPLQPNSFKLRLTDPCIDLPRLLFLIEDSFNRRLDVQNYLERVNDKLAGIIIAGEYEGAAILTWERPADIEPGVAYQHGHLVPYLDKFAVLKRCQGSAGVADIVFNAMVQDCFPAGVCWRSRKDNPVNKWYFERSAGTCKLPGTNWTMFWTTPGLCGNHSILRDYEAVCRGVQPSWADNEQLAD
ncbi:hypothetical protein CDD81_4362 [Ophiocordyceps australis]|uniref:Amino-acid acetyltransferase, mitochondrial n=1 Tax=Ophiocordyceps australis TaxID=1399860 RepID=A0A2C5XTQ2_9HYPO|nr:hypothetical protein CDD81_4362 [Ophiocordyceps australis]